MFENLKDKTYYRKKCHSLKNETIALKAEVYDLKEKLKAKRIKDKKNLEILEKVKQLPMKTKKELKLID